MPGNGEQIPGSGVWASLPRSDAFLTGDTDGPPLKRAPFDRRYSLWGRNRDPRVGHVPPASHSDASAAEWHATTPSRRQYGGRLAVVWRQSAAEPSVTRGQCDIVGGKVPYWRQ
ncbi:hypothetical protein B0H13DRAFT_1871823 [Mycena leptocephala]|nr:hypothetical protein B0H13DRAFT_1871823 [Mycena leptocephala]